MMSHHIVEKLITSLKVLIALLELARIFLR